MFRSDRDTSRGLRAARLPGRARGGGPFATGWRAPRRTQAGRSEGYDRRALAVWTTEILLHLETLLDHLARGPKRTRAALPGLVCADPGQLDLTLHHEQPMLLLYVGAQHTEHLPPTRGGAALSPRTLERELSWKQLSCCRLMLTRRHTGAGGPGSKGASVLMSREVAGADTGVG